MKKYLKDTIKITGEIKATIQDAKTGKIKRIYRYKNLIVTVGRSVIAQRLSGTITYSLTINYGALGTGTTAPTNGDTQLETEVYRKAVGSATHEDNIAYVDMFFAAGDCNGTYKEFGYFIDGSGVADSGQLWNRVAVDWTKSATESLTVEGKFTIA